MSSTKKKKSLLPNEITSYYDKGKEAYRLHFSTGKLELARTQEIIERYLPERLGVIFDIGGGAGVYACWLAKKGYEVHLIDPVPLHVEQAKLASLEQPDHPIADFIVGDAREVARFDASVDMVLMLGPLYHLVSRDDRLTALREAKRILRKNGILIAAAISRFASTLDGLFRGFLDDADFREIARRDMLDGQHRNPTGKPGYFTTAYFHHPESLKAEIVEAGLAHQCTLPVEGPGWLLQNFDQHWNDAERRQRLLSAIRALENEPSILGVSGHILAIAKKT